MKPMASSNKLFSFKGRLNRKAFWLQRLKAIGYFILPMIAIFAIFGATDIYDAVNETTTPTAPQWTKSVATLAIIPLMIAYIIAVVSITVRRFHDINQSGWWAIYLIFGIVPMIQVVAWIATIALGCVKGKAGSNRYGDDPLKSQRVIN